MAGKTVRQLMVIAAASVAVIVVGLADVVTGPDLSLSLLYIVVVAIVAWVAGRRAALASAVIAVGVWAQADFLTGETEPLVRIWNGISRATIFSGAGLLIATLRAEERRLKELDREREEFLALVAHELRQPVAAIAVAASVLASTPGLPASERRVLTGLRSQAHRLTGLAEDLLTIGRLEGRRVELSLAEVDLGELVEGVVRDTEEPGRIRYERPGRAVLVQGDVLRIAQVIDNLVSNALKYSPPDAPVGVEVGSDDGAGRIIVSDQGVGIAPGEMNSLFRKYGRIASPETAEVQGVGLGLYLVRLITEAHGGHIRVESAGHGKGSVFTVELPLHRRDER